MPKRELYEAAGSYRASALWEKRSAVGLFAVKYADGAIGYCVSTGGGDVPCTLSVYLGEEKLNTLVAEKMKKPGEKTSGVECLMCSFSGIEELMEAEMKQAQEAGLQEGIFPRFRRHEKRRLPWTIADEKELEYMRIALLAANEIAANDVETPEKGELIALSWDGEAFEWGIQKRPELDGDAYERAPELDEINFARLRRLETNKGAKIICDLIISDQPQEGEPPYFPAVLLLMNEAGVLEELRHSGADGSLDEMCLALVDYLLANGKPDMLIASNRRSKAYFEKVCRQISLPLVLSEEL